ncbi:MAG TPA: group II intron maturase-specific domain-containing protein, partial [Bacillota bacterium]|nr:group II intron maturase-specific domain-containing protein [Bacillota bacterium]HQD81405.1 group II intron maturase-specific domain-containing protein [Bacillota bacterium]
KTHITSVYKGVPYLGFVIHPKKLAKFKDAVRKLTPRNHGMSVEQMVKRLNRFLRGWINYFRIANCKTIVASLMGWIRRRLRMKQMREWKSWRGLHKALRRRGYSGEFLKISMRRWRNSASPLVNMALPQAWFSEIGLIDLTKYEVGVLHLFYEAK